VRNLSEGLFSMLKQTIAELLTKAILQAQKAGKIPTVTVPEIIMERPQKPEHGDYASSIPLKLARAVGMKPMALAQEIINNFEPSAEIAGVTAAPPGFINVKLNDTWVAKQVDGVLKAGSSFGNIGFGKGKKIQVEFVSVNPTGPLHVGHGRGAVLGSTLASILSAAGYETQKEYYINDAGNQIDTFRRSLYARYLQANGEKAEVPEDGYHGAYMADAAKEIAAANGKELSNVKGDELANRLGKIGLEKMLAQIKTDLEMVGVSFDEWFSESTLMPVTYPKVTKLLEGKGYLVQREGATWFTSTTLGEDKDNVVVRSDGSPTYFGTDIAYHYNKFIERGFDTVIDIWGADHAGHVSRMKAVMGALGVNPENLTIIISQMVTLRRGNEIVKISKRSGDIITLRELVEEVGADACRFFFLSRTANSQMDFDLELAKKQSTDNPVYYVQYAHARINSILKLALEKGASSEGGDVSLLTAEPELTLIRKMLLLPEMVETIAMTLEPHHLTYYAQELATDFHAFYKNCRVVTDDPKMTAARLKLVKAAKIVLGRTLNLMGMNAPDKM
jgi:arginyl-tRNA synthetase